jgi:hypothetical protein
MVALVCLLWGLPALAGSSRAELEDRLQTALRQLQQASELHDLVAAGDLDQAKAEYAAAIAEHKGLLAELESLRASSPQHAALAEKTEQAKRRRDRAFMVFATMTSTGTASTQADLGRAQAQVQAIEAELAELPAEPLAQVAPASDTPATAVAPALPPVLFPKAAQPNPVTPPAPATFASQTVCDTEVWSMQGVPWRPTTLAAVLSAPAPQAADLAFSDESYRALLGRVQAVLAELYAPMSFPQQSRFQSLWAPFYDYPNAADHRYFSALLPLLDQYLRLLATLKAGDLAQQDSLLAVAMAGALKDEGGVRAGLDMAYVQVQQSRTQQQALTQVVGQIKALGDPPNPLAERCAARHRHAQARAALAPDTLGVYVLRRAWQTLAPPNPNERERPTVQITSDHSLQARAPRFDGDRQIGTLVKHYEWDVPTVLRFDEVFNGEVRIKDLGSQGSFDGRDHFRLSWKLWDFEPCVAALAEFRDLGACTPKVFTFAGVGPHLEEREGTVALRDDSMYPEYPDRLIRVRTERDPPTPSIGLLVDLDLAVRFIYQYQYDPDPQARSSLGLSDPGAAASAQLAADPALAISESITQHQAVLSAIETTLTAWESELQQTLAALGSTRADAASAKRLAELEDRVLMQKANRQAEYDAIATLERGTLVHTRSAWDDRTQQLFRERIVAESEHLSKIVRAADRLPQMARLLGGSEGEALASATLSQIHLAFAQIDPLPALRQIGVDLQNRIEVQSNQAQRELGRAERAAAIVEWTRSGADAAIFVGAFLATGGSSVAMVYGVGTGFGDGGWSKAIENGSRSASQTVDVMWAGYAGYYARDPKTGVYRGWRGAAEDAGMVFAVNLAMGQMAKRLFGADAPVPVGAAPPRPAGKPATGPRFEAFKSSDERYADDLAAVAARFPGRPASDPAVMAARAAVEQRHAVIAKRQQLQQELDQITRDFEKLIPAGARRADGSVDPSHPQYQAVRSQWDQAMQTAWTKHNVDYQKRMEMHVKALEAAGLSKAAAETRRLIAGEKQRPVSESGAEMDLSGGVPGSIKSDIDFTENAPGSARKFIAEMEKQGATVIEYPDRYVITDTDTTLWKRPAAYGDAVGSSAWSARIELDTYAGSDKFPTPGGVFFTTGGKAGVADAKGAVLSNLKKATEAGIGNAAGADLHVVGKSTTKIIEIANSTSGGPPLQSPKLLAKAQAMREHRTPEQAGVVTFGNPAALKAREQAAFLAESRELIARAYLQAANTSRAMAARRQLDLAAALARGEHRLAAKLRYDLAITRGANDAALANLAKQDPELIASILRFEAQHSNADLGTLKGSPAPGGIGVGWLWTRQWDGSSHQPPAATSTGKLPPSAELNALGSRCQKAASALDARLATLPANSPEAKHFLQLQSLLRSGATDPANALGVVRRMTGYELATVLSEIEAGK